MWAALHTRFYTPYTLLGQLAQFAVNDTRTEQEIRHAMNKLRETNLLD